MRNLGTVMRDLMTVVYDLRETGFGSRYISGNEIQEYCEFLPDGGVVATHVGFSRFAGMPLIPQDDGYLLYLSCEYCYRKELPEKNLLFEWTCQKCGAPLAR